MIPVDSHDAAMKLLGAIFCYASCLVLGQAVQGQTLRSLYVEDQRDRQVALADDGVNMLPKDQADKLPTYDWVK